MKSIDVFISSTQFELESEREIAKETIEILNLKGVLFELSPALSGTPEEKFLKNVDDCEIFVIIFWKYYSEAVLKEYKRAVEKNKPILVLVKELRNGEIRDKELEDFLEKYRRGGSQYNMQISKYKQFRTLKDLRNELQESIKFQINKMFEDPISTQSRSDMYNMGSEIITYTQKRLFLFQRTPTLMLGLKDRRSNVYLKDYERYEETFMISLANWIEKHCTIEKTKFGYLFDIEATKAEINSMPTAVSKNKLIAYFSKKIKYYKEIEIKTKGDFKFGIINKPISGPLLIGDNKFGIWLNGGDDAIAFSQENAKISDILVKMITAHFNQQLSSKDLILMLNS